MKIIEVNDLSLTYLNKKRKETVKALNNVSLHVLDNSITTIVGPTGCGKTSLLKVLLGILPYDSGTILYKGDDIDKISVEDRNFAYVSQELVLF